MVEIPTYQIGIFVFDPTFSIEKKCAKTRPYTYVDPISWKDGVHLLSPNDRQRYVSWGYF